MASCCSLALLSHVFTFHFPLRQLMPHCSHHTMGAGAVVVTCTAWHQKSFEQSRTSLILKRCWSWSGYKIFILTLKSSILKSSLSLHRPHLTPASFDLRWRHLSASVGPTIAHLLGKTSEMHLFLPANLQWNIIPTGSGCKKRIHQILKQYKAIPNFDVNPQWSGIYSSFWPHRCQLNGKLLEVMLPIDKHKVWCLKAGGQL